MPQDMPPVGGYRSVQYKRNLPARGFRPSFYLLGMGVIMTYGFYKLGKGIREEKYVWCSPLLELSVSMWWFSSDLETGKTNARQNGNANLMITVNLRAKRCGPESISRRCYKPKKIAIKSEGFGPIRREKRNYWAKLRSHITVIGAYYLNPSPKRKCVGWLAFHAIDDGPSPSIRVQEVWRNIRHDHGLTKGLDLCGQRLR
jgi:hypothetical protein